MEEYVGITLETLATAVDQITDSAERTPVGQTRT